MIFSDNCHWRLIGNGRVSNLSQLSARIAISVVLSGGWVCMRALHYYDIDQIKDSEHFSR